jgi:DNA-binding transcriptional ArsR family regulator
MAVVLLTIVWARANCERIHRAEAGYEASRTKRVLHGGCVAASMESAPAQEVVRTLAALSDVNRYRIVELLADSGELSCGVIGSALRLSPSLVSHHLSVLESAGVIQRRKDGLWTLNRLRRDELARRLSGLQRIAATG